MLDGIIKETGNSRYLRSVSGFLQLYPTYEAFAQALVAGTLPIDWNGINTDGWTQQGTPLNKSNLLTDATAALADLGPEATPNEMFAALVSKVNSAQSSASSASSAVGTLETKVNALIQYGTADLTAGTSNLATGSIYVKYE